MVSVRIFQLREVPVGNLRADHIEVTVFAKLTKKALEPFLKTCFTGISVVKPSKNAFQLLKKKKKIKKTSSEPVPSHFY